MTPIIRQFIPKSIKEIMQLRTLQVGLVHKHIRRTLALHGTKISEKNLRAHILKHLLKHLLETLKVHLQVHGKEVMVLSIQQNMK